MKITKVTTNDLNTKLILEGTTPHDNIMIEDLHNKLINGIEQTIEGILSKTKSNTHKDGEK